LHHADRACHVLLVCPLAVRSVMAGDILPGIPSRPPKYVSVLSSGSLDELGGYGALVMINGDTQNFVYLRNNAVAPERQWISRLTPDQVLNPKCVEMLPS
jgi:hypothetical protein